ncbi:FAD-dependent monooxygenase [Mycobacterium sp.]|jgi:2-polyprenyl-6-methoxyphenol hydroxylase-like FAD-dependent oxidoreductase|uniref:FAD-dependent monooxygenase n=1 Tax=Mycobacterium sp. TaxID=1785 RepID=UPI002D28AFBE|nr:FAD-dependent monooxygenase [Mycobacterium sp.]HZA12421.1 FAD-dependent monooxygenase [Mycobacterium sp.]
MPADRVDVVIAGGGPNGLMVACELALAGIRPVVLERLPESSTEPKANGLIGQVIRTLDLRGLYHELAGSAGPPRPMYEWMFSGMRVRFAGLEDNPMFGLPIPQPRLLRRLNERAHRLGVQVRWGHELTGVVAGTDGVGLTVAGPDGSYHLDTVYLVGADGGRSQVRKSVGIEFPGTTSATVTRMAHVYLPDDLRAGDGTLDIPGFGRLPFGHNRLENGGAFFAEMEPGRPLIATMEFGTANTDEPMTLHEMRESLKRVLGVDVPIGPPRGPGPHALRRIDGQNTRQAERYRAGNVFLVGDSAHVHSAMGGPGLNLGLQDAMNLGWKLAAQVNGWAPAGLLDTYQSERYPVGERVMMHSLSQTALMAPGPETSALRRLFAELLQIPAATAHIAQLLAGSDVTYDVGDDHPLSGRFVPDLTLDDGRRVAELLHDARPVLLDVSGGLLADAASAWPRVDVVVATVPDYPVLGLLIRPDGYVAWAADEFGQDDERRLRAALRRWFGTEDAADAAALSA